MVKKSFVILFLMIGLGSLSAQTFNHKLVPINSFDPAGVQEQQDTVRILAVMVQFQPDKDGATVGDGTFGTIYSQDYGNTIIDPLPHDNAYFNEHLLFVKNYFRQVSGGKLTVLYTVLPKIITVNQRMRNYSPATNSTDFSSMADFSKEVWTKADSAFPGFDFKDYNLFTIFHAGVGRDLSLPGSLSDSKDLPSVFLNTKSLTNIYGSGFHGFSVSNGSFYIKNTLIMPETESREQSGYGTTQLYQVSINGLMAASVGSYLGLPDLFDTETGSSAIGRFGLEDGQSIFAYNGVFPPEPSAWEKIFLGWATPVTVQPGDYNINLVTRLAASAADTVILKVPISSSEYFLVQNRQRDANGDGAKITYYLGGKSYTETFLKDQTGFYSIDVDSLKGVITDVDEFDWALPGQIDDTSDYKGGILIWHIDDNIIDSTLANDRVNANKNDRGVNLMEASGVPQIGVTFTTILGDQIIGEGSYEDYWYKNNPATLYKNIFSDNSRPSSKSNSGANSLITFSDFSVSGNKMNFNLAYGDSLIKPLFSKHIPLNSNSAKLNITPENNGNMFSIVADNSLNLYDGNGNFVKTLTNFSEFKTASVSYNSSSIVVGAIDSSLTVLVDNSTVATINVGDLISAAPVIYLNGDQQPVVLVGTVRGIIKGYSLSNIAGQEPVLSFTNDKNSSGYPVIKISAGDNYYSYIEFVNGGQFVLSDNKGKTFKGQGVATDFAATKDKDGNNLNIVLLYGNQFNIVSNGQLLRSFTVNSADTIRSFAIADLKQDGNNYIVFTNGNKIDAVNLQGAEADNFPFPDPASIGFAGTPLCADFSGDAKSEIISYTKDGRIFALDGGTGQIVDGFPLTAGGGFISVPALLVNNSKLSIAAINDQSNFTEWNIGANEGTMFWSEEDGNNGNAAFVGSASQQNISNEFFPAKRTYNYPNPVYGSKTYIHYYVAQDSKINIKIFDIAGDFVAELNDVAQGGMEKETAWDVSGIQSGVYLARVEAQGNNGETETNIIKIAVVK